VSKIIADGMELPNAQILAGRIDALVSQGLVTASVARSLQTKNQAHETNRAGRVWFCFFPPHLAGESGISSFFRLWGGEALYKSHDRHPTNSEALRAVGTPSIVEAKVPIASLGHGDGLAFKIIRRYLVSREFRTSEPFDHEGRIIQTLSPRLRRACPPISRNPVLRA
jgi:hypothetical protein